MNAVFEIVPFPYSKNSILNLLYYDTKGNFSIHWKSVWDGSHMDAGDMKEDDYWFWTQGMHQGYKADFSFKGVLTLRKISKHGVYVTPPTPSYIHAPEHRIRQRPSDLKEMAGTIKEGIQINATDVRMIRFDQITEFVDAVDGVHYGYNVNRVLFSIYLNGLK